MAEKAATENISEEAMTKDMTEMAVTDQDSSYGVENEYRMALIGKTGSGKSATGNNILGTNDAFESSLCGTSVTKTCGFKRAERFGKRLLVVDTPGLFDTTLSNDTIEKEITKCVGILSPGPHAFILVVSIGRFTPEEKNTIDYFSNIFGEEFFRYLIVLFTRKDELKNHNLTMQEYLDKVPDALKDILQRCGRKYIGFDNSTGGRATGEDACELIKMLEAIMIDTGKSHYSNGMFEEAEREFQRIAEEKQLEEKKKLEKDKKKLEEKLRAEQTEENIKRLEKMMLELTMRGKELENKSEFYREAYRKECESGKGNIFSRAIEGVSSLVGAAGSKLFGIFKGN